MSKRQKAGLPDGFKLDIERPESAEKPVRLGDYLDDITAPSPQAQPAPEQRTRVEHQEQKPVSEPKPQVPDESDFQLQEPAAPAPKPISNSRRARLNVSLESRRKLSVIVDQMAKHGPERDVRASEVLDALILALYDAREHLDLSNVRPRGKYGSPSHKNFPVALAESISKAFRVNPE